MIKEEKVFFLLDWVENKLNNFTEKYGQNVLCYSVKKGDFAKIVILAESEEDYISFPHALFKGITKENFKEMFGVKYEHLLGPLNELIAGPDFGPAKNIVTWLQNQIEGYASGWIAGFDDVGCYVEFISEGGVCHAEITVGVNNYKYVDKKSFPIALFKGITKENFKEVFGVKYEHRYQELRDIIELANG